MAVEGGVDRFGQQKTDKCERQEKHPHFPTDFERFDHHMCERRLQVSVERESGRQVIAAHRITPIKTQSHQMSTAKARRRHMASSQEGAEWYALHTPE